MGMIAVTIAAVLFSLMVAGQAFGMAAAQSGLGAFASGFADGLAEGQDARIRSLQLQKETACFAANFVFADLGVPAVPAGCATTETARLAGRFPRDFWHIKTDLKTGVAVYIDSNSIVPLNSHATAFRYKLTMILDKPSRGPHGDYAITDEKIDCVTNSAIAFYARESRFNGTNVRSNPAKLVIPMSETDAAWPIRQFVCKFGTTPFEFFQVPQGDIITDARARFAQ